MAFQGTRPPSFPIRKRTVVAALTPEVKAECMILVTDMYAIQNRQARAKEFETRLESLSTETRTFIGYMIQKEEDHKLYVNTLLRQIPEFFAEGRKPHDFSKDPLFCFIMSFRFDCEVGTEEMLSLTADEFRNHYQQEAHHPEWEAENNQECSQMDILEMAIDRVSRNLQRNDGFLNEQQMMQYLPRFPLGDNEGKQKMYLGYVKQYTAMVRQAYVPIPKE